MDSVNLNMHALAEVCDQMLTDVEVHWLAGDTVSARLSALCIIYGVALGCVTSAIECPDDQVEILAALNSDINAIKEANQ